MSRRGRLCPVCGSPRDPEIVAPGQGRCIECGHGFSFSTTTLSFPPRTSAADRKLMAAEDRGHMRKTREAFDFASFEPHALDERWTGLRWIGGWGGSDETSRLELGHGENPFEPGEQIRVGTHGAADDNARAMAWAHLAQECVNAVWSSTGVLDDEMRRAAFPLAFTGRDPTEPWDGAEIEVDGIAVPFRVLAAGDAWYAQAHHGDVVLSITAGRWPITQTGLVSVFDVSEYVAGSEEMRRRAQAGHDG